MIQCVSEMLVLKLVLTFVCALVFQGILCENNATEEQTDVLTIPINDAQNVPDLFHVNELLSSSIPLPVQLLLIGDYEQNKPDSLLNISQNYSAAPIYKKRKPVIENDKKILKDGDSNGPRAGKPKQRKTDANKKRHRISTMENKKTNRTCNGNFGKNIINSTEGLYNGENINKAVEYLLRILKNPHNFKELESTNASNTKMQKIYMDIDSKEVHSFDSIDQKENESVNKNDIEDHNLKNMIHTPSDTLSQLLQEQNNLLKEILFKTSDNKNHTNSDDKVKKIHLILDINNLDSKSNEVTTNLEIERNDPGPIPEKVHSKNRNDTDENTNSGLQSPIRNDDSRFKQYPQHYILNSHTTSNYFHTYFVNPFNKFTYYDHKPCNNNHPIANNTDAINKVDVIPEDDQEMLIYEPKNLNEYQPNDATFNNHYKYKDYFKIPSTQHAGTFYYRKPYSAFSKCPFHDLYYRRQ